MTTPPASTPRLDEHLAELTMRYEEVAARMIAGDIHVGADPHAGAPSVAAVVPLRFGRTVAGAIAIFALLPHREAIDAADVDLLHLLSLHAAPALRLAALRADAPA